MILSLPALYSSVMPTVTSYLSPAGDAAVPREKPSALRPGDTIGIVAPGTHGGMTDYNQAIHFLEEMGYKVKLAPSVTADYGYLAGSDEERAADINNFFKDDSVKAVVCLRGGYGSARLLSLLDYSMIEKHPKLFVGFSDVTALHATLGEKSHLVTIHGPMLSNFEGENFTPFTLYNFENGLTGSLPTGEIRMPQGTSLKTVVPGKARSLDRRKSDRCRLFAELLMNWMARATFLFSKIYRRRPVPHRPPDAAALAKRPSQESFCYRIRRLLHPKSQKRGVFDRSSSRLLCKTVRQACDPAACLWGSCKQSLPSARRQSNDRIQKRTAVRHCLSMRII